MALPTEGSYFRQIGERARKLDQPAQEGITGSLQAGIGQAAQPLGASQIQAAGGQIQGVLPDRVRAFFKFRSFGGCRSNFA